MDRLRQSMLVLGLVACLGLFFVACDGQGGEGGREYLTLGTAPAGGAFYVVGGAIADTVDRHGPEQWSVSAESTGGSMENIRLLLSGEIDFAMSNASITFHAHHRLREWADEPGDEDVVPVVNMMTMFPNIAVFLAREDSAVERIADLEGRRVYIGPEGAGFEYFVGPILEAHGLSLDDIRPVYGSQQSAVDYLGDGSVAAAMIGGGVPTAAVQQATQSMNIRFLAYEDQPKADLIEEYPFFEEFTLPGGTYRGQDDDFHGLNVGSAHLMVARDADEEKVYHLTRTVYEERERIAEGHAAARAINAENVVKDFGVPWHPGAVRYYQEAGLWPEERDVQ